MGRCCAWQRGKKPRGQGASGPPRPAPPSPAQPRRPAWKHAAAAQALPLHLFSAGIGALLRPAARKRHNQRRAFLFSCAARPDKAVFLLYAVQTQPPAPHPAAPNPSSRPIPDWLPQAERVQHAQQRHGQRTQPLPSPNHSCLRQGHAVPAAPQHPAAACAGGAVAAQRRRQRPALAERQGVQAGLPVGWGAVGGASGAREVARRQCRGSLAGRRCRPGRRQRGMRSRRSVHSMQAGLPLAAMTDLPEPTSPLSYLPAKPTCFLLGF